MNVEGGEDRRHGHPHDHDHRCGEVGRSGGGGGKAGREPRDDSQVELGRRPVRRVGRVQRSARRQKKAGEATPRVHRRRRTHLLIHARHEGAEGRDRRWRPRTWRCPPGSRRSRTSPASRCVAHSASVTGITDSREMRTSGNSLNAGSALISASVTGPRQLLDGRDVHDRGFAGLVFGSGYASPSAFAMPTTAFSSPVW